MKDRVSATKAQFSRSMIASDDSTKSLNSFPNLCCVNSMSLFFIDQKSWFV